LLDERNDGVGFERSLVERADDRLLDLNDRSPLRANGARIRHGNVPVVVNGLVRQRDEIVGAYASFQGNEEPTRTVTLTTSPIPKRISLGPRRSVNAWAILGEWSARTRSASGVIRTTAYGRLSASERSERTSPLDGPDDGRIAHALPAIEATRITAPERIRPLSSIDINNIR
jgi:hypothetical protein